MFIGRAKELIALEDVYNKKGFGMTVIYGSVVLVNPL